MNQMVKIRLFSCGLSAAFVDGVSAPPLVADFVKNKKSLMSAVARK